MRKFVSERKGAACTFALAVFSVLGGCSDAPNIERSLKNFVVEFPPSVPLYVTSVMCEAPVAGKSQSCSVTFNEEFGVPGTLVQLPARDTPFPSKFTWIQEYDRGYDRRLIQVETDYDGKSLHIAAAGRYLSESITAAHDAAVVKQGALYQQKLQLLKNLDSYR